MSKHTPGPWKQGAYVMYASQFAAAEHPIHAKKRGRIAKAYREADARLISAAPDLLAALIEMEREKADYMIRNNLGDPSKETTNRMARAAIAKAEGR